MNIDILTLDRTVKSWLSNLEKLIHSYTHYNTKEKLSFRDLVSEVDVAVEKDLSKYITSLPGEHAILGEEKNNKNVEINSEHLWVLDPIDGTANFLKQNKDYGIMIAYFQHGEPILSYLYDVADHKLYSAIKDEGVFLNNVKIESPKHFSLRDNFVSINPREMFQTKIFQYVADYAFDLRFLGSSIADGIRVINGQFSASINLESEPWDRAPFVLFAEELGLEMIQFNGKPITLSGIESYFFGSPLVFEEIFSE